MNRPPASKDRRLRGANMVKSAQILSILLGIAAVGVRADVDPVTGEMGRGDAAAQSFAEFCRDELPADRRNRFYVELGNADREVAAGNTDAAGAALNNAWLAAFRGGGETDVSVRCLGEQATRRWFNTRLELWRRGSSAGLSGGMGGGDYTTLYVAAADRGSDGVVAVVENRPAEQFIRAYHSVENIIEVSDWAREYGTLTLPEEQKIAKAARDALPALQEYAKREHAATLAAEDKAFNRPATQMELDAAAQLGNIGKLAESMAGADFGTADQQQTLVLNRQVDESRALLEKARGLEVEPVFGDISAGRRIPSGLRAEMRGDILFERGGDESLTPEFRDELYELSIRYYNWCNCRDQAAAVADARRTLQPALAASEAQRRKKMEKMQAEMQQKTEAMQKSIDDMQKTEAEKQSFKDEADALEAELDF